MLPSHLPGRGPALGGGVVLIIMCAKAERRLLIYLENAFLYLRLWSALLESYCFHSHNPVLISLSLKIPSLCCGFSRTLQTPKAPRRFSTFSYTLASFQRAKSCMQTGASSRLVFETARLSLSALLSLVFFPHSCFQSLFLSFGCEL